MNLYFCHNFLKLCLDCSCFITGENPTTSTKLLVDQLPPAYKI